jgi:DNA polymerase-3 subunit gamma/tau
MYIPFHLKYRPGKIADLIGQPLIQTTLENTIKGNKIANAYLLEGGRGTGKTSTARILAKSLNCLNHDTPTVSPCGTCINCKTIESGSSLDVFELDAASNNGVDDIRKMIESAQFSSMQSRYRVFLVDECLSGDSLVFTDCGLTRIDSQEIVGRKALSYNETLQIWEYKAITHRWTKGVKKTLLIRTETNQVRCTENHFIRTEDGWIKAKDLKVSQNILTAYRPSYKINGANFTPVDHSVLVDVTNTSASPILLSRKQLLSTCKRFTGKKSHISEDINKKQKVDLLNLGCLNWKLLDLCVRVVAEISLVFPKWLHRMPLLNIFNRSTGKLIPTFMDTEQAKKEGQQQNVCNVLNYLDLFALVDVIKNSTSQFVLKGILLNTLSTLIGKSFRLSNIIIPSIQRVTLLTNWRLFVLFALVNAEKDFLSQDLWLSNIRLLSASFAIGKSIHTLSGTGLDKVKEKLESVSCKSYLLKLLDDYTGRFWVMPLSHIPMAKKTQLLLELLGLTVLNKKLGLDISAIPFQNYNLKYEPVRIKVLAKYQLWHEPSAIQDWWKFTSLLTHIFKGKVSQKNGLIAYLLKGWLGGLWMMGTCLIQENQARHSRSIPKGIRLKKIKCSGTGLCHWGLRQVSDQITEKTEIKHTTTLQCVAMPQSAGLMLPSLTPSHQWSTSSAKIISIEDAGECEVYDITVEDNHNFLANGLLVHNCHFISKSGQAALLKTLEEPPAGVVFLLCTTDPEKLSEPIISRCLHLRFGRIGAADIAKRLADIAGIEKIDISLSAMQAIASMSKGGMRDALQTLEQLTSLGKRIEPDDVRRMFKQASSEQLVKLVEGILSGDVGMLMMESHNLIEQGLDSLAILHDLLAIYRDLYVIDLCGREGNKTAIPLISGIERSFLDKLLPYGSHAQIEAGLHGLQKSESELQYSPNSAIWLEICLLRLASSGVF